MPTNPVAFLPEFANWPFDRSERMPRAFAEALTITFSQSASYHDPIMNFSAFSVKTFKLSTSPGNSSGWRRAAVVAITVELIFLAALLLNLRGQLL